MKKKNSLILDDEFILYCQLNNIDNMDKLAKETFNRGFSLLKYPETPIGAKNEKIIEKEIIKEVIKEVPIEKIIEVEKIIYKDKIVEIPIEVIKEVPVEITGKTKIVTKEIIKEVPVEKIIIDTEEVDKLKKINEELSKELENIKLSLNKFNKGKFLKNSDLGSLYSE